MGVPRGRHGGVTTPARPRTVPVRQPYLSLFYIGFYLKDMERLKEVRLWPKAVPSLAAGYGGQTGPRGPWALQPLPSSSILLSSLSIRLCVLPLPRHAPPICLSTRPSGPPQLLIVLSLSQSLERQLWAVLVPPGLPGSAPAPPLPPRPPS